MEYFKYHALGNDYIVLDAAKEGLLLTPENVRLICHRNFGIGSDGILEGPVDQDGAMSFRIWNPDGSLAEKSGNGIRIFSRFLVENEYVRVPNFSLRTAGGDVDVEVLDEKGGMIRVNMGRASFWSQDIPATGANRELVSEEICAGGKTMEITGVTVGNPHCVVLSEEVSRDKALEMGASIENHPLFPNRTNVQFMKVLDRNHIRIEIWERGAGYTLASGSSSCAAASAAYRLGLVDAQMTVMMPGGNIEIHIRPDGCIWMTGPVSAVGRGRFAKEFIAAVQAESVANQSDKV